MHDYCVSFRSPLEVYVRSQEDDERSWDRDERVQAAAPSGCAFTRAGLLRGARVATRSWSCGSGYFEGRADDG